MDSKTKAVETKKKNPVRKTLGIILNIVIGILVVLVSIFLVMTLSAKQSSDGKTPTLLGYSPLNILSDSMDGDKSNSFSKGDLIIIKSLSDQEKLSLKKGDIITFNDIINGKREKNSHRIIEVIKNGAMVSYKTMGDNKPGPDETLRTPNEILGKYQMKIPKVGGAVDFMQTKLGGFLCLVLPLLLFFIWRVFKLIRIFALLGKEKKKEEIEAAVAAAKLESQPAAVNTEQAEPEAAEQSQDSEENIENNTEE